MTDIISSRMGKPHLVISGSIAIDRIMNFSGNYHDLIDPNKLDVLSLSVLVESLSVSEGGIGANIAYYMAQLGEKTTLLGSIGNDGKDYLTRLEDAGVDTAAVNISSLPTASFNVLTDTAGNQVGGFYPGAMSDAGSVSFLPLNQNSDEIIACLSAHDPEAMRRQTTESLDNKLRLVYDPGQQVSTLPADDLRAGVEAAEVVFVNEYELSLLCTRTGLSEKDIINRVQVLVMTKGKDGSRITLKEGLQETSIGIARPGKLVDPTGAGDAYRAGFLYGYLRQWDMKQCGQLGSVIASYALEHAGPQTTIKKDDLVKRYLETFNERIEL